MQLFEIQVLLMLALALVGLFLSKSRRPRWMVLFSGLALLFVAIHLLVEGWRWQMAPAYVLAVLLLTFGLVQIKSASTQIDEATLYSRRILRAASVVLGWLCLLVTAVLCAAFPIFHLPKPTGPYAVGTMRLHLVDEARSETFTVDPADHRELLVQAWYPAKITPGAKPAAYWAETHFPFGYLRFVRTHSYQDVPLVDTQALFPVLIFSHGYFMGYVAQNTAQMEDLASHGYVVFSIAHPYEAWSVTYPDGRRVSFSEELFWDRVKLMQEGAASAAQLSAMDDSVYIWADDTIFVIDELERVNAGERDGVFAGRLDLARLGVFGMSFGGATAAHVCLVDSRCRAGINLDGSLWGDLRHDGGVIEMPFMMMYHETVAGMNESVYRQVADRAYQVTVEGTTHGDFGDMTLMFPPLRWAGFFGPIDGYRMLHILNAYTLAFFDEHLKGEDIPLLDGPSPEYPEVAFQSCSGR